MRLSSMSFIDLPFERGVLDGSYLHCTDGTREASVTLRRINPTQCHQIPVPLQYAFFFLLCAGVWPWIVQTNSSTFEPSHEKAASFKLNRLVNTTRAGIPRSRAVHHIQQKVRRLFPVVYSILRAINDLRWQSHIEYYPRAPTGNF